MIANKNDFCLTSGQSSPDETQRVLFLQDKRRGPVTQAGVSPDETRSEQRRERQEGTLRSLTCSQELPFSYWLKEQPGIRLTRKNKSQVLIPKLVIDVIRNIKNNPVIFNKRNSVPKWTSGEKSHHPYCINNDFMCFTLDFTMMLLVLGAHSLCHSFTHLEQLSECFQDTITSSCSS